MTQWNPLKEMEALRRELEQAFENFGLLTEPPFRTAFLPGRLHEDKDALYLEALAPGLDPASLHLTIARNALTLSGEKQRVTGEVRPEAFHRSEREAGKFVRTVELPVEVEETKVKAEYKNGLLLVTLPKAEKARARQIDVQVI
jgi:HSP20 family protein